MSTIDDARAAKVAATKAFADLQVVGVGVTRIGDGYGVKVNVREAPAASARLPEEIDGVPVRVEVVGAQRKLDDKDREMWEKSDKISAAVCARCGEVRRVIGEARAELGPTNPKELVQVFGEMLDKALMHLDANEPHAVAECLRRTYSPYGPVDRAVRGAGLSLSCIENAIFKTRLAREMLLKEIRMWFQPSPCDLPN